MEQIRRMGLKAGVCVAAALALPAWGGGESFNITNVLVGGTPLQGFPTNTVATNGIGQATGGAVSTANYEQAGFYFTGLPILTNGGSDSVTFTLVRAWSANPPGVTYGTNNWSANNPVLLASDWETYTNATPPIVLTVPVNGTNAIAWYTNLLSFQIGRSGWGARSSTRWVAPSPTRRRGS